MRNKIDIIHNWIQKQPFFIKSILNPFFICFYHKVEFFLWFMFVIVAGQLGTIINIIQRVVFDGWNIQSAIVPDSISGNFYTFSLVLLASLLGPLFIEFIKEEKPHYRRIGVIFVTILIFAIILCAVFYSFTTHDISNIDYTNLKLTDVKPDFPQLFFYIIAILCSWYYYGYLFLGPHENELNMSDEYQNQEEKTKEKLSDDVSHLTNDGKGIKV